MIFSLFRHLAYNMYSNKWFNAIFHKTLNFHSEKVLTCNTARISIPWKIYLWFMNCSLMNDIVVWVVVRIIFQCAEICIQRSIILDSEIAKSFCIFYKIYLYFQPLYCEETYILVDYITKMQNMNVVYLHGNKFISYHNLCTCELHEMIILELRTGDLLQRTYDK